MHPVIKSHLNSFVSEHGLSTLSEPKQFEAFVNYCVLSQFYLGQIDPSQHIYSGDDPGIDGILFVLDGELVTSLAEVREIINKPKNDMEATVCFIQSKSGEDWKKKEINTFESAIIDFLREDSLYPHDEYLKERKEIFLEIVSKLRKIRNGKPNVYCYYATSGKYRGEVEIEAALQSIRIRLEDSGYFHSIEVFPIDRDKAVEFWVSSYSPIDCTISVIASASFPKSKGIEESYVVTLYAKEFLEKVLMDSNGVLRKEIFEENVRDFLGTTESDVNAEIGSALGNEEKRSRFGILNNGITVISPDVRLQGTDLYMENFQIVNGCQTSNVLFENRGSVTDDVTLTVKIIETTDLEIVDEIVRATNNQNKVEDYQFLASLDAVKNIQKYFLARSADEDHKIYFARRHRQYAGQGIPDIRVFDIREIARCVGAMFFDRPDLATRYPNQLTTELKSLVFNPNNREEIYYAAAFTLYRLLLHIGNNRIPYKYRRFKWYILMLIKFEVADGTIPRTDSSKIEALCEKIISVIDNNDERNVDRILKCCDVLDGLGEVSNDRMKRQALVDEAKQSILKK